MKLHHLFLVVKNSKLFLTILLSSLFFTTFSQSRFGFKTSLGFKLDKEESVLHISDGMYTDRVTFLGESNTQSVGLFFRKQVNNLFVESDVMYSKYTSQFKIQDLTLFENGISDIPAVQIEALESVSYTDSYSNIDFSILAGYSHGNIDFGVGPIFHRTILLESEISEVEGYQNKQKAIDAGFLFKVGYNLGPLNIGLRYEDYFFKPGDHFTLDNRKLKMKSGLNVLKIEIAIGF